jgi:hypothetical protein
MRIQIPQQLNLCGHASLHGCGTGQRQWLSSGRQDIRLDVSWQSSVPIDEQVN